MAARRVLLGQEAALLTPPSGKTADAEFQATQIGNRLDLLPEPAAHLAIRVAGQQRSHVVALVDFVKQVFAATQQEPALIEARVGPKRQRVADCEGTFLAELVVLTGIPHFNAPLLS